MHVTSHRKLRPMPACLQVSAQPSDGRPRIGAATGWKSPAHWIPDTTGDAERVVDAALQYEIHRLDRPGDRHVHSHNRTPSGTGSHRTRLASAAAPVAILGKPVLGGPPRQSQAPTVAEPPAAVAPARDSRWSPPVPSESRQEAPPYRDRLRSRSRTASAATIRSFPAAIVRGRLAPAR
jgi:hypothetical protein